MWKLSYITVNDVHYGMKNVLELQVIKLSLLLV